MEATARLFEALRGDDLAAREEAAAALEQLDDGVVVPALIQALDGSGRARNEAIRALGRLGPQAAEAVPRLLKLLTDDIFGFRVKDRAMRALVQIGDAAVPGLIECLHHADTHVQRRAATALGDLSAEAAKAPLLEGLLQDYPALPLRVRRGFAYALQRIAPAETLKAVNASLEHLKSSYHWERATLCYDTLRALGETHPTPEVLLTPHAVLTVSYGAMNTIRERRRLEAVPTILEAAQSKDSVHLRPHCFDTLGVLKAKEAVPTLCELLKKPTFFKSAVAALGAIGDPRALPALVACVEEELAINDYKLLLESIARIGGVTAARFLIARLDSKPIERGLHTAKAIGCMSRHRLRDEERFMLLRELLDHPHSPLLWMALCAFLERWPERDDKQIAVDYANAHCAEFVDSTRVPPDVWWNAQFSKRPDTAWGIVRRLNVLPMHCNERNLGMRLHHKSLRQIVYLSLRGLDLDSKLLESLATSPQLPALRILDLGSNSLGHQEASILAKYPFFGQLEKLILTGHRIGEVGLEALRASAHLRGVEVVL